MWLLTTPPMVYLLSLVSDFSPAQVRQPSNPLCVFACVCACACACV